MSENENPISLVQNWNGEFPEFKICEVAVFGKHPHSWSGCAYDGKMFHPHPGYVEEVKSTWVYLANEETQLAFIGETKIEDGKVLGKIYWD